MKKFLDGSYDYLLMIDDDITPPQNVLSMVDHGKIDPKLISMAKWFAGEMGVKVIDEVVQIHGGYGYLGEYGIERLYRDVKLAEIVEGPKEIEKLIIAREILGRG